MKIGITRTKNPEKNSKGVPFEYTVWFRTSDGKLRNFIATADLHLDSLVENIGRQESKVQLNKTDNETQKEVFLESI